MEVVRYTLEHKQVWDAFVADSKNATFLFYRDYMEYHADRFTDHSLLFYHKNRLIALMSANELGAEIVSHEGLSYGGILSGTSIKVETMLQLFDSMVGYFRQQGFTSINYKTIPHIYHQLPAEEDLYALYKYKAQLYRRDVLAVVEQSNKPKYSELRRRKLKEAKVYGWEVAQDFCFEQFMELKGQLLEQKYKAKPVHTLQELLWLAGLFPENIKLFVAKKGDELGAGVVVYETETVAHCQYIATSEAGRANGALDALLHYLIAEVYADKKYFDLGASMDSSNPSGLNRTLLLNKESYGARAVVHDFYTIAL